MESADHDLSTLDATSTSTSTDTDRALRRMQKRERQAAKRAASGMSAAERLDYESRVGTAVSRISGRVFCECMGTLTLDHVECQG
jgi:hypothetical protein